MYTVNKIKEERMWFVVSYGPKLGTNTFGLVYIYVSLQICMSGGHFTINLY